MEQYLKVLLDEYQVRKTEKQKTEFIEWLDYEVAQMGYTLDIQKVKQSRNLVVGNPKTARVILTAHYDTQPNALIHIRTGVSNHFTYLMSQLIALAPIFIGFFVLEAILVWLSQSYPIFIPFVFIYLLASLILVIAFAIQITYGVANKHTVNDNTSGVATLLKTMDDLPEDLREKVCLVFFDHEEVGLVGSKRFKKEYKDDLDKPVINFDCVADGETFLFVCKKAFRKSKEMDILQESSVHLNKPFVFKKASTTPYPSDQLWFKQGVGVVAVKKHNIFGYYLNNIHTNRDTAFQYENIIDLSKMMIEYIEKTNEHEALKA